MNEKTLTYSELIQLQTFEERLNYLRTGSNVGQETFGYDRYLNQGFYQSREWKQARNRVIVRDCGCDLGCKDYDIFGKVLVHHLNPITADDIINKSDKLFDPENLITISDETHRDLHYGSYNPKKDPVERKPGDTKLW